MVVRDISLLVNPGEFVTLLGPSGSGKSTTLMMIAGFVQPDSGSVLLDGAELVRRPAHRRSIGIVFQSYALFPHMTVLENIAFALRMRDISTEDIDRRVVKMVELIRLDGLEKRYPRQLSGGQQQRVALARALVFEPPLLLLDEPLGALDRLLREHMKLELRRIHRELRTTVVYVTHDQDEALVLSDRIVVMNEGRIEQTGTPSEVYERPANAFVARFIGESNVLCGLVHDVHPPKVTVRIGETYFYGHTASPLRPGDAADIMIRPEKIVLGELPVGSASPHQGVVRDAIYSGESIRYSIDYAAGGLTVKHPSRHGTFRPRVGDPVSLAWDAGDVCIFPTLPSPPR
jgi:spermidine/putrescine ABC transporter ATP-binding subunit